MLRGILRVDEGKRILLFSPDDSDYPNDKDIICDDKQLLTNYQGFKERYEELDDKIIVHYDLVEYDDYKVKIKIKELKNQLAEWDYKVSKNNEYRDAELPLPYSPQEIHARNQPMRDEINLLEDVLLKIEEQSLDEH